MIEIEYDSNSPEAYLVFNLCFPFIKHDIDEDFDDCVAKDKYDMYRCASICMDVIKAEMHKHHVKVPEYYETAHMMIMSRLLDEKQKRKQLNK